jgi:hypothetical protein
VFFFYRVLYGLLKIKRTFISCIKFLLFYAIVLCYIYGFKYNLSNRYIDPIYIEDLPLLTNYKYVVLSIISIMLALLWALSYMFVGFRYVFSLLKYPYIKEGKPINDV